jgi:hypothetical protein
LEEHEVAVARAGGNIDGVEQIKVSVPGVGSAAELKSAELISKHVNEYLGGPQVKVIFSLFLIFLSCSQLWISIENTGCGRGR